MHMQQPLTLTQAVKRGDGKISYQQLWRGIQAGRVAAYQPSGPRGRYLIDEAELERVLAPITRAQ